MVNSTSKGKPKSPSVSIESQLNGALVSNKQVHYYIRDLVKFLEVKIGQDKIVSLMLFGSNTYNNDTSKISDCDLLVILSDDVTDSQIKSLEKYFLELEIKHDLNEIQHKFLAPLLRVIEKSTGMYVSHFITRKIHWLSKKFSRIFRVNRVFAFLFAPRDIVLKSVISSSILLIGKDLRHIDKEIEITSFGMIKSILLNLIISIFALGISPFYHATTKYELEAIKWSLRASNFYLYNDTLELEKIASRFIKLSNINKSLSKYMGRFKYLRRNPFRRSFRYSLFSPFYILKIHILGLKYKKLVKDRSLRK